MRKVKKYVIDNCQDTTVVFIRDMAIKVLVGRIFDKKNKNCVCLDFDFFYHKLTKKFYSVCCEEFRLYLFVYEVKNGNVKENN